MGGEEVRTEDADELIESDIPNGVYEVKDLPPEELIGGEG